MSEATIAALMAWLRARLAVDGQLPTDATVQDYLDRHARGEAPPEPSSGGAVPVEG